MNYFLIYLVGVPLLIAVQIYILVRKMSEPEKMMRPIDNGLSPDKQQVLVRHQEWLASRNFSYLTSFQFGTVQVAVFQQQSLPRFFCVNFHKGSHHYALESHFGEAVALETATSGSTGMFPARPGGYRQGFPNINAEEVWQRHLDGETHLMRKFGLSLQPLTRTYEEVLLDGMRAQMQHVRSIPLYPFLSIYWFAVVRAKMRNRTVQQQFP
jgi:hypothetical protein